MLLKLPGVIFFFLMVFPAFSQDTTPMFRYDTTNQENAELLHTYLNASGSVDKRIFELIELAKNDYTGKNSLNALHKIQIALILEKQLPYPDSASFYLNVFASDVIRTINMRYALEFVKKATEVIKNVNCLPPTDIFNIYTNRAGIHSQLLENDTAVYYFRKAMDAARQDSRNAFSSSHNNLGVFYQKLEKYDSARVYFEKAKTILGDYNQQINLYCAIMDNLAQLDMVNGEYRNPLKTFIFNDSVYQVKKQSRRYFNNRLRLLDAMQHLGLPGIEHMIDSLLVFSDRNNIEIKPEEEMEFYRFAYQWYFKKGNEVKQDFYYKRMAALTEFREKRNSDELDLLTATLLNVQETSFQNEMNVHLLNAEKSKLKLRNAKLMFLVLVVFTFLAISTLILYIRKRKQDYEIRQMKVASELKRKEMESRLIQQELELKKRDLTNIVLHNTQVYDSNQKMIDRLQVIAQQKKDIEQQVRSLLIDLQGQNQISERSIGIQANIETVNAEFYEKLNQRFPDLTKAETELCGYIRINLSSKDISILKNVEAASVKMGKNRLRKKLGLEQEANLYDFIRMI